MDKKCDDKSDDKSDDILMKFDENYITIVNNESNLYNKFNKRELIENRFHKNKFKLNSIENERKRFKSQQRIDLKKYYKLLIIRTKKWFICKFNNECKQTENLEENIVQHIRQHLSCNHIQIEMSENSYCFDTKDNYEKTNDWMVLDEWTLDEDNDSQRHVVMSDVSDSDALSLSESLSSEDYYLSSDSEISNMSSDESTISEILINGKRSRSKTSLTSKERKHLCNWFGCEKRFAHLKCYLNHQNKHLIDINGHKDHKIENFSFGFYRLNDIEDYIEIIEENDCEKFFCKYNGICDYETLWSYQLVAHIRSEHTCYEPFICDWIRCGKILLSKDVFAHRLSHFGSEIKSSDV